MAPKEILVVVVRAYGQRAAFERQARTYFILELEGILEGSLLAEFANKERIVGALHPVGHAYLLEELGDLPATALTVLKNKIGRANKDNLAHGEVPEALERSGWFRFVPEAAAAGREHDGLRIQRAPRPCRITVVAHRGRERLTEFGKITGEGTLQSLMDEPRLREAYFGR